MHCRGAFDCQVLPDVQPWTFGNGCPKKRIPVSALEMFGSFILCDLPGSFPDLRVPIIRNNQGNIYSLLNSKSKKMPTPIRVMELWKVSSTPQHAVGTLSCQARLQQVADELTYPD